VIQLVPASNPKAVGSQTCICESLEEIYITVQRKPMRTFPMPDWVKLGLRACYAFMRWVNQHYGFAASDDEDTPKTDFHNVELRVAHPNEVDAWHDANCEGGAVKRVPWRSPLPPETVAFGSEVWPALDGRAQRQYQARKLEIVSFRLSEWELLQAKIEQVARSASA
jgi:hypothetical protein